MRYVGEDDTHVYLKCGHCKKVHAYDAWPGTKDLPKKVCAECGKPFRTIFFRPIKNGFQVLKPWLPPLIMALFSIASLAALNSRFLLHKYQFNLIITTSHSLLSSIVVTMIGAVLSEGLSRTSSDANRPNDASQSKDTDQSNNASQSKDTNPSNSGKMMPTLFLIAEAALLIFLINVILTLKYSTLSINNPNTDEP